MPQQSCLPSCRAVMLPLYAAIVGLFPSSCSQLLPVASSCFSSWATPLLQAGPVQVAASHVVDQMQVRGWLGCWRGGLVD
jgi:hypothetical protein